MKTRTFILFGLLLGCGPAVAQTQLTAVEVRGVPDSHAALSFDCNAMHEPSLTDVESLLQIKDPSQTKKLAEKLEVAVNEACKAGIAVIVLTRGKDGQSLTWDAVDGYGPTTVTR